MKYVICSIRAAEIAEISVRNHRILGADVVLNEREVMTASIPGETLAQRVSHLGGKVYSIAQVKKKINTK